MRAHFYMEGPKASDSMLVHDLSMLLAFEWRSPKSETAREVSPNNQHSIQARASRSDVCNLVRPKCRGLHENSYYILSE